MNIKNENYHKADLLLYHISLAADNLENLAAALDERYSDHDTLEANAVRFVAYHLAQDVSNVRELLFASRTNNLE